MEAILVVIPFLISAIISAIVHKEDIHKYVAFIASIATLAIAIMLYFNPTGIQTVQWFSTGNLSLYISTSTSPIHLLLLLIVSSVSTLIMLYSMGFMRRPSEQRSYYFAMAVFTAAMLLFAIGADLITIFIGWELLGITSYLLIGFWHHRDSAINAARKAILTVFIGDILMFGSIMLIWTQLHTFSLGQIIQQGYYFTSVKIALVMIIVAAFTKSAQFPFNEWLPDAMEGPTPVSAFLHSSTMVKAGVFIIALLLPLIAQYGLNYLLLAFGIISAVIGAVNAASETHIKRILAYSTIEDIGLMFIALGFNSIIAAMLLFFVQTLYKALLFMSAGSIMKANDGEENINKLHGPRTWQVLLPTLIGVASLAGIFPLSGFFGKIAVESAANNIYIYAILVLIELVSSIYIFRWLLVPLKHQKGKSKNNSNYSTIPKTMIVPIYILAILIVLASLVPSYLAHQLGASMAISINYISAAIFLAIVFIGAILAYFIYYKESIFDTKARKSVEKVAYISKYINNAYLLFLKAIAEFSQAVFLIDYYFYQIIKEGGRGLRQLGIIAKKAQNGDINYYLFAFVLGLIVIIILAFVI